MPDSRGRCLSLFPGEGSQRLSADGLRGHVASMTRHRSAWNAVTCPPKWHLFIYLHLHAFKLQGWQELGRSNRNSPRCADSNRRPFDQPAQQHSSLNHRATCGPEDLVEKPLFLSSSKFLAKLGLFLSHEELHSDLPSSMADFHYGKTQWTRAGGVGWRTWEDKVEPEELVSLSKMDKKMPIGTSDGGTDQYLHLFGYALGDVASIHPECKIFQQVMKDEARCLDKNDTLFPDFQGNFHSIIHPWMEADVQELLQTSPFTQLHNSMNVLGVEDGVVLGTCFKAREMWTLQRMINWAECSDLMTDEEQELREAGPPDIEMEEAGEPSSRPSSPGVPVDPKNGHSLQLLGEKGYPAGCAGIWDGLSCWPKATFGEVVTLPCPGFFEEITKIHGFLHRNCTPGVFWSEPFPPYSVACGFEEGLTKGPEDQKAYYLAFRHIYTAGYAISLASLITALLIFAFFRDKVRSLGVLLDPELSLEAQVTAVARSTFLQLRLIHQLRPYLKNDCLATVRCKAAVTFFQFSILANFFWLLVEGMYLQTLLVLALVPDKQYAWRFILVGWGRSLTTEWYRNDGGGGGGGGDDDEDDGDGDGDGDDAFEISSRSTSDCNTDMDADQAVQAEYWMNFSILLNVIRILVQKLQSSDTGGRHARNLVRLAKSTSLLIPLFGAHYVVFALFPESIGVVARLYIELGLGSFQGFVVALLYCFLNGEVQAEFKKRLHRWRHQRYLSFARKHQALSRENSPVTHVTQLSLLDRISPKRSICRNSLSTV
ncbi:Vasoactive intestinal polypeptide receptor [Varanus komodoensis]|nr:Vasoactive intestinal polypeptide receptor [Varanus komodoensis]